MNLLMPLAFGICVLITLVLIGVGVVCIISGYGDGDGTPLIIGLFVIFLAITLGWYLGVTAKYTLVPSSETTVITPSTAGEF